MGGGLALHELVQQIQPAHVGKLHVGNDDREAELLRQGKPLQAGAGGVRRPLCFHGGGIRPEFIPKSLVFGDKQDVLLHFAHR